jgi:hypothetical protein
VTDGPAAMAWHGPTSALEIQLFGLAAMGLLNKAIVTVPRE